MRNYGIVNGGKYARVADTYDFDGDDEEAGVDDEF